MRLISAGSQVRILSRPLTETRSAERGTRREDEQKQTVLSLSERRDSGAQTSGRLKSRAGSLTSTYRVVSTTFRAESETFGSGSESEPSRVSVITNFLSGIRRTGTVSYT